MPKPIRLSKSKYCAGCQCLKRLYWAVHKPDGFVMPTNPIQEAIFAQGHEVGELATKRFPGGVLVEEDFRHPVEACARTQVLIKDKSVPAIFEAGFEYKGVLVRVDILERLPRNKWRIVEVKSSTGVKDCYLIDLAIQTWVLSGCGLKVSSSCLMHLNREYYYQGRKHDLSKLFTIADRTQEIKPLIASVPKNLRAQIKALSSDTPPDIEYGEHCHDPYDCDFMELCAVPVEKGTIYELPRLSASKCEQLADLGVEWIADIPYDFPLSVSQSNVVDCIKSGEPVIRDNLADEIAGLGWPRYFLDFETAYPAIPMFKGLRPYDHVPFQWSLHKQSKPGAPIQHFEFLSTDGSDPREPFITKLLRHIGKRGPIIVYNAGFESQRLREIAAALPKKASEIQGIIDRFWDLLPAVRDGAYHESFGGSFSLKAVLPAFVPELDYSEMTIGSGDVAGVAYKNLCSGSLDPEARKVAIDALLKYCGQDTLGLVRLLDVLSST